MRGKRNARWHLPKEGKEIRGRLGKVTTVKI